MKLSVIVIGDEILLGQVTDTNSGFIARTLGPDGWQMQQVRVVADTRQAIKRAVDEALEHSDLVITTGGLGPTRDDVTKSVMLEIFGGEMRRDPEVTANIERVFARRGLKMNALTASQAMVPTSCRVIQNRYGTAPVMWFERHGRVLVAMPGVPFETEGVMRDVLADEIRRHFRSDVTLLHHTMMVAGISESALAERLAAFEDSLPDALHLAYLPTPGLIRLRLDGASADGEWLNAEFEQKVAELQAELGTLMIYDGDATAAEIVINHLRRQGLTMATAESCTGGNIAHRITEVAGCSDVFVGAVVSYANEVKIHVLGVDANDIAEYGAVSEQVVRQMADGVRRTTGADCAVATSGVAGPGGGTPDKPVGTVWIAAATPHATVARLLHLPGDRRRVIDRATTEALLLLAAQL